MQTSIVTLDMIFVPSDDLVIREIEGEIIIIPLAYDIGEMGNKLHTLNQTAKEIWIRLDGTRSLRQIANELASEYSVPIMDTESDVINLITEFVRRKLLVIK